MQNLKRNWLVVPKLTWGIWQILTRALGSLKNVHFDVLFLSRVYIVWAKKYRGVIFHDTEEWYKIWRGIDLSFQNWQEEFDIVWLEHLEVSKIFPLMGSFWAKYILFELKNTGELSFMTLKSDTKFGVESTCSLKIDMRNLTNFDLITWKSQKYSL